MTVYLPHLAALALVVAVMCGFAGFYRMAKPTGELEDRLQSALKREPVIRPATEGPITRLLKMANIEERLGKGMALELAQADLDITLNEYAMIRLGAAAGGILVGLLVFRSALMGLPLAIAGLQIPVFVVHSRQRKRQLRFQGQLVDVISMLVSGLRAGVGLVQAMDLVRQEMPAPASDEIGRAVRENGLGVPIQDALGRLTERMPGDDLAMVVTVINIQAEVGGNLANVLDGVVTTIRERVRLAQEIRTLTSQQRYTGYLLAGLPFLVGGVVAAINPGFLLPMFQPRWIWLPGLALGMMFIGFMAIRKIVDIKV